MTTNDGIPTTTPTESGTEAIGWPEAVARLTTERTRAETCAALLKKYGDIAAIDQGGLAYGEAKAEVEGIIAGLVTALAQRQQPGSLPELETRLERVADAREALFAMVTPLVPERKGEKSLVAELLTGAVGGAVGPVVETVKALWLDAREGDRLAAKTIATRLDATRWPDFAMIAPLP